MVLGSPQTRRYPGILASVVAAAAAAAVLFCLFAETDVVGMAGILQQEAHELFWTVPLALQMPPPPHAALEALLSETPQLQAVILNLNRSTGRWKNVQQSFAKAGVPVQRFPAVEAAEIEELHGAERRLIHCDGLTPRALDSCHGCHGIRSVATALAHYRMIAAGTVRQLAPVIS